jgi:hypothetical protein
MLEDNYNLCGSICINTNGVKDDNIDICLDLCRSNFVESFFGEIIRSLDNDPLYRLLFNNLFCSANPDISLKQQSRSDIVLTATMTWGKMKETIRQIYAYNVYIHDACEHASIISDSDMINILETHFISAMEWDFKAVDF